MLCERDAGRLWGVSLCGPMVIFDQATGTRATSQPEPDGQPALPGADGPVSWGGLRWFAWPLFMLPQNDADTRQQIMLHGLFHRVQPELGLLRSTEAPDRMELEGQDFHAKVADAYLKIAEEHPERFIVIRADREPAEVFDDVRSALDRILSDREEDAPDGGGRDEPSSEE